MPIKICIIVLFCTFFVLLTNVGAALSISLNNLFGNHVQDLFYMLVIHSDDGKFCISNEQETADKGNGWRCLHRQPTLLEFVD